MSWRRMKYKTKLNISLVLLSCIPAVLIGAIAYQQSYNTLVSQTEKDFQIIVSQLNASIERQISDFDSFTMLPYYLPNIFSYLNQPSLSTEMWGTEELEAQRTITRLMSAYPSIHSSISGLIIYGMNGTVSGYRMDGDEKLNLEHSVETEGWYQTAIKREGGFIITGVEQIHSFRGKPFEAIIGARMLRDEDFKPLAVIEIMISPRFIPNIVKSLNLQDVQITVIDQNGEPIYTSDQALAEQLRQMNTADASGAWELNMSTESGKVVYMGNYEQSEYLGWTVYMGVNKHEMLASSRYIRNLTFIMIAFISVLSGIVSWFLARGLSKPIYRLIRSMRDVEKGVFAPPLIQKRSDEIGQLEESYIRMIHRLNELVRSIEEKESQKRHAELYAQRARIQPHFLYNTLNSIRMLAILHQDQQIAKLLQSLSKLLQANLKFDSELISLKDEIALLEAYSQLMDLRYTNVFEVEWKLDERALQASIPPMLLQVLMENAIFHGAKGLERLLHITVEVQFASPYTLYIHLYDNGVGLDAAAINWLLSSPAAANGTKRIGLCNVRDRVQLCFGKDYGLYASCKDGITCMTVHIPFIMHAREV